MSSFTTTSLHFNPNNKSMRKHCLLFTLVTFYFAALSAQQITTATPEAAGFSGQRLQKLDKALNEWAQKEWMNGAAALVIRNGKIAYYNAVGYNDLGSKAAIKRDDIFRIASQTKAITSVAI